MGIFAVIGFALLCACLVLGRALIAPGPANSEPRAFRAASATAGVRYYIADLKTSFPEHASYSPATALTQSNYRLVLDGLKNKAGVNGVRLPIIPAYAHATDYPPLYRQIYDYARGIGLSIYASPMSVGMEPYADWSSDQYVAWLADYADKFSPDFLSPFNEAGIDNRQMSAIVEGLKAHISRKIALIGPDRQHVDRTLRALDESPSLTSMFDIVSSHNADRDRSATMNNWAKLVRSINGPVWASENPSGWDRGRGPEMPGIDQAVAGGVEGLVIWMAKPTLIDEDGQITDKARLIADHLKRR